MKLIRHTVPQEILPADELLKLNMRGLLTFSFFSNFRPYYVIVIVYFAHIVHSYALAASILAVAQIAQACMELPTGILSDRIGRVTCIRIGALTSIVSLLLYTIASDYSMLVVGALLEGLWVAMFSGNNNALIYDSASQAGQRKQFHSFYSRINVALESAGFLAAILGGLLAARSFSLLLWVSVIPQVLAFLITFRLREPAVLSPMETTPIKHLIEALRYYRQNTRLRVMSLAAILGDGIGGAMFNILPTYYRQYLPLSVVGSMVSFNYIASAVGFKYSNWFMRRFNPLRILIGGELYSRVVGMFALSISTIFSPFLFALSVITYGPSDVAKQHLLHEEFTDNQRATMQSFNSLLSSGLYAIFLVIAGWLADRYSPTVALLVCSFCSLPIILMYRGMFKSSKSQS
jgi:MFS family permease